MVTRKGLKAVRRRDRNGVMRTVYVKKSNYGKTKQKCGCESDLLGFGWKDESKWYREQLKRERAAKAKKEKERREGEKAFRKWKLQQEHPKTWYPRYLLST